MIKPSKLPMKKIWANLTDSHISYVYEDICLEKMWDLSAADGGVAIPRLILWQ